MNLCWPEQMGELPSWDDQEVAANVVWQGYGHFWNLVRNVESARGRKIGVTHRYLTQTPYSTC
jgi:hypothetical protein